MSSGSGHIPDRDDLDRAGSSSRTYHLLYDPTGEDDPLQDAIQYIRSLIGTPEHTGISDEQLKEGILAGSFDIVYESGSVSHENSSVPLEDWRHACTMATETREALRDARDWDSSRQREALELSRRLLYLTSDSAALRAAGVKMSSRPYSSGGPAFEPLSSVYDLDLPDDYPGLQTSQGNQGSKSISSVAKSIMRMKGLNADLKERILLSLYGISHHSASRNLSIGTRSSLIESLKGSDGVPTSYSAGSGSLIEHLSSAPAEPSAPHKRQPSRDARNVMKVAIGNDRASGAIASTSVGVKKKPTTSHLSTKAPRKKLITSTIPVASSSSTPHAAKKSTVSFDDKTQPRKHAIPMSNAALTRASRDKARKATSSMASETDSKTLPPPQAGTTHGAFDYHYETRGQTRSFTQYTSNNSFSTSITSTTGPRYSDWGSVLTEEPFETIGAKGLKQPWATASLTTAAANEPSNASTLWTSQEPLSSLKETLPLMSPFTTLLVNNLPTTSAGNVPTTLAGNVPTTSAGNVPTTLAGNVPATLAGTSKVDVRREGNSGRVGGGVKPSLIPESEANGRGKMKMTSTNTRGSVRTTEKPIPTTVSPSGRGVPAKLEDLDSGGDRVGGGWKEESGKEGGNKAFEVEERDEEEGLGGSPPSSASAQNKPSSTTGGNDTAGAASVTAEPENEKVWEAVTIILGNKPAYKAFLNSRGEKAQMALDIMQKLLDSRETPEELRRPVLYATMRLCAESGAYPQCLALRGIHYDAKPVASGSFGEIWRGYHENRPVCLKVARVYQGSGVEHLIKNYTKEAIMWSQLKHPNLLPFYGVYQLDEEFGRVCLVAPWMQNGNVCEYLRENPEVPRMPLVHEILAGLRHLHENSIVHGDLKGANILITPAGSACLADFGLSCVVDADILRWTSLQTMTQAGGTVRWEAPELMDELEDGTAPRPTLLSDVYSVASVMYEILTGRVPFYEFPRDPAVISRVMKGHRPSRPPSEQDLELSDDVWKVMEECWSSTPNDRPTVGQVTEKLREIPPSELTMSRMAKDKRREQEGDWEALTLTPRSFRNFIRGHDPGFSRTELDFLREYVG